MTRINGQVNPYHMLMLLSNLRTCLGSETSSPIFHHPLKHFYFRAATGLMACMKALDYFNTNLFNLLQALPIMIISILYL